MTASAIEMRGTIAITDYGWYERLRALPELEEVNFWKPSAARRFNLHPSSLIACAPASAVHPPRPHAGFPLEP